MTPEGVEHVEGSELAYGECAEDFYSTYCGEQGTSLLWDNFTRALFNPLLCCLMVLALLIGFSGMVAVVS